MGDYKIVAIPGRVRDISIVAVCSILSVFHPCITSILSSQGTKRRCSSCLKDLPEFAFACCGTIAYCSTDCQVSRSECVLF